MATQETKSKPDYGMMRVASAVPSVNVADVDFNVEKIGQCIEAARKAGAQLLVLPELCITAYTCADLFGNELLLDAAEKGIQTLCEMTRDHGMMVIVGAPLRKGASLFNCAVVMQNGHVLGVVPKTYIPNYKEFYEKRWFAGAHQAFNYPVITIAGEDVPFGSDLIFDAGKAKIAIDVCEDLWTPIPPSTLAALRGANVLVNLSASDELVGKHENLIDLVKHQSRQCIAAYVYSSAGYGESSTDLVFAGNAVIAENGEMLKEGERFSLKAQLQVADIDLDALNNERRVNGSFADNAMRSMRPFRMVPVALCEAPDYETVDLLRPVRRLPFVPQEKSRLMSRCHEIVNIQTQGLMRRMEHTHIDKLVIGVSGGIDSTLALMVATRAYDRLGYDRKNIYGITMPGFGTTDRTYNNALELMKALGITVKEISIAAAVTQHFKDIEHDIANHDVTYENSQARERTQILMDFANKINALVLGTGDLSELALGWATYNGDHMSMYNVNGSIPKTLARHLVMWFATENDASNPNSLVIHETLLDVLDTPISPELTPANEKGEIQQKTEDLVGPYELHDFFLYNMLRHGYSPRKIFLLANVAFKGSYDRATIKKWLTKFMWRFFSQQFKRSCLPDGPKVGCVSLSPRGDWRMPSDAAAALWVKECDAL